MEKYIFIFICCASIGLVVLDDPAPFRLQNDATPKSYNIKIQPHLSNNSFDGEVIIYVELQNSLRHISLNFKDLKIQTLVLDNSRHKTGYKIDERDEMISIYYEDRLYIDPGEHMIYVKYSGMLRSGSVGFFKSVIESEGKEFVSAATMFSAPYARTAFPCFDEPAFKSRFSIRLVKPNATFTALSNMEKIGSFKLKDGIAVDFQTTPSISPYIVCFVFTQYKYKASEYLSRDGRIIPIRFFLLDEYLEQTPFLLDVAVHALQFFEEYTNMTYPTSKLDFIEVQNFIFEGMENVGLVILTHNAVSFNASRNDLSEIQHSRNAAQLIVHEIAHMWFGDIVTPLWYNDLWLAEGFAELMEIKGLDNQYTQWQLKGVESVLRHETAFEVDKAPVVNFPEDNDQVDNQFSDIIYVKGSTILNMLEQVMGEQSFRNGVRRYLKDFFFNSAATGDFLNIMQYFTFDVNIRRFLETWLHQDNFPVISIKRDNVSNSYILHQKTLLSVNTTSIFGRKWTIPVHSINNCKEADMIWFDRDMDELRIPIRKGEKWTKLNPKANGFYRVLYSEELYGRLMDHFDELDPVDQADLIQESLFLVLEQEIPCEIPLKFIGKLKNKEELLPSLSAFRVIQKMTATYGTNRRSLEKLRKYFIHIFKELYEKLTWKVNAKDGHITRLLRASLLETMCLPNIEYEECYKDAEKVKADEGKFHMDVNYIWKSLPKLVNSQRNVTYASDATDEVKANSTSSASDRKRELYNEKCLSWIKMNL